MRVELESAYSKIRFLELEIFEEANAKMDRISNENLYIYIYIGYIIVRDKSLKTKKKRFVYLFRAPLFLGMWYGVATYFSLYKRKKKY